MLSTALEEYAKVYPELKVLADQAKTLEIAYTNATILLGAYENIKNKSQQSTEIGKPSSRWLIVEANKYEKAPTNDVFMPDNDKPGRA